MSWAVSSSARLGCISHFSTLQATTADTMSRSRLRSLSQLWGISCLRCSLSPTSPSHTVHRYAASLYLNSKNGTQWFLMLGSIVSGCTDGLMYAVEGPIITGTMGSSMHRHYFDLALFCSVPRASSTRKNVGLVGLHAQRWTCNWRCYHLRCQLQARLIRRCISEDLPGHHR